MQNGLRYAEIEPFTVRSLLDCPRARISVLAVKPKGSCASSLQNVCPRGGLRGCFLLVDKEFPRLLQ